MGKRITILGLFLLLAIMPLAFASTNINVKATPGNDIVVNVLNPSTGDLYQSVNGTADANGLATMVADIDSGNINLYVIARNQGSIVIAKEFDGYRAGAILTLDLTQTAPKPTPTPTPTPVVNKTNTTSTTTPAANTSINTSATDSNKVSGKSINVLSSLGKIPA
jgi:hypothetical protein